MMIKNKLNRIAEAENNKILEEHKGLYNRLISENYSHAEATEKKIQNKKHGLFFKAFAPALIAAAVIIIAVTAVILPLGGNSTDGDNKAEYGDLFSVLEKANKSGIMTGNLSFKNAKLVKNDGKECFELSVDTFNLFDIYVCVGGDISTLPDKYALNESETYATVTPLGFNYVYSIRRTILEDCYLFDCRARLEANGNVYYILYSYMSEEFDCDFTELIGQCIRPSDNSYAEADR